MLKKPPIYRNRIELLQGTLDLLILQTLQWGPRHGYGISQAIRTGSSDVLRADTGSLYPALHRLERAKWIVAEGLPAHRGRQKAVTLGALSLGAIGGRHWRNPGP